MKARKRNPAQHGDSSVWSRLSEHFYRHPLTVKIIVRVVVFSIFIAVLSSVILTWSFYRDRISEVQSGLDNTVSALQKSLVHSIWSIDHIAIEGTLEGLLRYPSVYNVSLITSIDSSYTYGAPPQGEPSVSRTYPLRQTREPNLWLGDLTLLISLEDVQQQTLAFFWRSLAEQLVKIGLIAAFLLLTIRYLILRHLQRLSDDSAAYLDAEDGSSGSIRLALERKEPAHPDELSRITEVIDTLRKRLEQQSRRVAEAEFQSHLERSEALQESQTKSLFIANIGHELRTPMNNIVGYSGLLMDTEQSPEQKEYVQAVQQSSESLLGMLNDMLDLSKLESEGLESISQSVDVRALLQETIASHSRQADAKHLSIESYVDAGIPRRVELDRTNTLRIMESLLSVAISLTIKGQVVLHVVPVSSSGQRLRLRIAVEDNGAGMSEEDRRRILANTFEAATAESLPEVGIGLKLALARELIDLLGGQFGIESQIGKGSTFWFETDVRLLSAEDAAGIPEEASLTISHVLLADTSELSLRTIMEQLGDESRVQIDIGKTPEHVKNLLNQVTDTGQDYDLFILDESIPDASADGQEQIVELIRQIRSIPSHEQAPILILTAHPRIDRVAGYQSAGASAYLSKSDRDFGVRDVLGQIAASMNGQDGAVNRRIILSPSIQREWEKAVPMIQEVSVLLVEDNEVNRNLARKMLEKCGCQVEIAENGEIALQTLASRQIDLVFMDCWMPVMDGYETTRQIRESGAAFSDVPVIALTANAFEGERQKCFEAGMNEFLTKPIRFEELSGIIHRFREGSLDQLSD